MSVCVCARVHVCTRLVTQLCPALCDPLDCSPPGSSVHGILQARILGKCQGEEPGRLHGGHKESDTTKYMLA